MKEQKERIAITFVQSRKHTYVDESINEWMDKNPLYDVVTMTTTRLSTQDYSGQVLVIFKKQKQN